MAFNWFKKKDKLNEKEQIKPDYNDIDSTDKAIALYQKKQLAKLYLMPLEFGGVDNPMNILYVPEHVVFLKSRFDTIIEDLLVQGKKLNYSANPVYKGKSFVPSSLTIVVKGDSDFTEIIQIW